MYLENGQDTLKLTKKQTAALGIVFFRNTIYNM